MLSKLRRLSPGKVAAAVGALTLGLAGTASAAAPEDLSAPVDYTVTCAAPICLLSFTGFPGGSLGLDIDADGQGWGTLLLRDRAGNQFCRTLFRLEAPPATWPCGPLAAGTYTEVADVSGTNATRITMGVRW